MERRRITTQERIDFFFQLDHDLRNHPSHIWRERMEEIMDDEKVPWSDEAIITILLQCYAAIIGMLACSL